MKKNTWNVRRLVYESFVPRAQRTSVLYCRLSDFKYDQTHMFSKKGATSKEVWPFFVLVDDEANFSKIIKP